MTYFWVGLATGFGVIVLRSWVKYRTYGTRADQLATLALWEQHVADALKAAALEPVDCPPEVTERLRADVQAAAWEASQTPIADRLAEERFAQQLNDPDQMRRWLA